MDESEIISRMAAYAQPFDSIGAAHLDAFIKRCSKSRVVLLGESSYGTQEFYSMKSRLTLELIERLGFTNVAIEWDWPDVELANRYIRHQTEEKAIFSHFPAWLWSNQEFMGLLENLRQHNEFVVPSKKCVNIYGLDFYGIEHAIEAVVEYLESAHPPLASLSRHCYSQLSAWGDRLDEYAMAAANNESPSCHEEVASILQHTLELSSEFPQGEDFFNLIRNMNLIVHAERGIRQINDRAQHWNLRYCYMFETLESILDFNGQDSKTIIWLHNNHIGNGANMVNFGERCKERFQNGCYSVGFGFGHGQINAAPSYKAPMQIFDIPDPSPKSYESLFHQIGSQAFFLPLCGDVQEALQSSRSMRSFGSVFLPESADQIDPVSLPEQFDEYIYFDVSHPLTL